MFSAYYKKITWIALLTLSGVVLPWICGVYGMEQTLVTMQIPVLISGFVLTMNWAVACAVITPILNFLLLGAPELFPALPIAVCEMIAYAAFANMFYRVMNWKIYPALLITMLLGRVVLFCAASILSQVIEAFNAFSYTQEVISKSWPGMLLQLAVVPLFVKSKEKIVARLDQNK